MASVHTLVEDASPCCGKRRAAAASGAARVPCLLVPSWRASPHAWGVRAALVPPRGERSEGASLWVGGGIKPGWWPLAAFWAIPKRPFVPRTAQPPYSNLENSTRGKLDQLGLTAPRAMVDVELYGSSDVGRDPSDDEPPSLASGSPSENDDPEDPENPSDKKKKRKRKSRRHERGRSKEVKAISTPKIVVNLPELTGRDRSKFAESFGRFPRMTSQTHATGRVKCDLLLQCCKTNYPGKQVKRSGDEVHYLRRRFGRLGEAAPFL